MDRMKINNGLFLATLGALVVLICILCGRDQLKDFELKKSTDYSKSFTCDRTTKIQRKLNKTLTDLKIMHKMMGENLEILTEYMNTVKEIFTSVEAMEEAMQDLNMLEI